MLTGRAPWLVIRASAMDFVPHFTVVAGAGASPEKWMLVLHGILGSGANWRSFAKSVVVARPAWGIALVDLRMHGQSQGAPPPHTVASAAADLMGLEDRMGGPVRGVLGPFVRREGRARLRRPEARPPRGGVHHRLEPWSERIDVGARNVVAALEDLPETLPSRARFFELLAERGIDRPTRRMASDVLAIERRRIFDFALI